MEYDPLGATVSDSAPDFPFPFGYRCWIADRTVRIVFLNGRVYDPQIGRWTVPDYEGLVEGLEDVAARPGMVNLYHNAQLWERHMKNRKLMLGKTVILLVQSVV